MDRFGRSPDDPEPIMVSIVSAQGPRRAALVFIFVTIALDMMAIGMIVPVLPKLVEDFLGEDTAAAARIYGVFGIVWALDAVRVSCRSWARCPIASDAGRSSCCPISVSGSTTC